MLKVEDINNVVKDRIQNKLLVNFVIAWLFINYHIPMKLLFSNDTIEKKIEYLNNNSYDVYTDILYPLIAVFIIRILFGFLNVFVEMYYSLLVENFEEHSKYFKKKFKYRIEYKNKKLDLEIEKSNKSLEIYQDILNDQLETDYYEKLKSRNSI